MVSAALVVAIVALVVGWLATRGSGTQDGARAIGSLFSSGFSSGSRRPSGHRLGSDGAHWARRPDLRSLAVSKPGAGRLTLGKACGRLVAGEVGHSLLLIGPPQSGKTTGLAVPALLEWQGPVLAASVKGDLARDTMAWRRGQGKVWVYDPTSSTGLETDRWSPLTAVISWTAARRVADGMIELGRASPGALTDGDFWYATAAKLLAPLVLAAAVSGRTMADVVRWIDEQETDEVMDALETAGRWHALQALRATYGRDERQRSAVYTTAETVVEVFVDPMVAASAVVRDGDIEPAALLGRPNTLYLCAPVHEQRPLRPLFSGLVSRVIDAAVERAARQGRPLDPPLLVVIDDGQRGVPG